jgi:GNAT superfamily N-acetyltransferase
MNELEIRTLPPEAAEDSRLVAEITRLVNEVYAVAEKGLWVDDAARTTLDEVAGLIRAGEITVALVDGTTVGCIRIQRLDGDTSEFGMLAAAPDRRGIGLGRRLVEFAERGSLETGRDTMQLELLVPRSWTHPAKDFLAGWYGRIGYAVTRTGTIDESYPHLAPLLATPCDFVIYRKDLAMSE